jgi:hypothetical protein
MVSGIMTITGVIGITDGPKQESSAVAIDRVAEMRVLEAQREQVVSPVYKKPDVFHELLGKKIPGFTFMLYVATCETRQNWADRGTYGGGFGFMHKSNKVHKDYAAVQSTWLQWGGAEFAKVPWEATSKEQALVFIRTFATGWVRPNGVFRPPTRLPRSLCHDDLKTGWHVYDGADWPVPDTWQEGDPQIKPWDK